MARWHAFVVLPVAIAVCGAQVEVASIKRGAVGGNMRIQPLAGGRLNVENAPLRALIGVAFNVRTFQIAGGDSWIASDPYDITAKAGGDATPQEIPQMLQTLLKDRFHLAVHRETREAPVYYLTAAKGGVKLSSSTGGGTLDVRRGRIDASATHMQELADALAGILGRPVIDKTGISGAFDVHLEFLPDDAIDATGPDASLFTVLEEQLGLRLESSKGPVGMLVIDHAEKPSPN